MIRAQGLSFSWGFQFWALVQASGSNGVSECFFKLWICCLVWTSKDSAVQALHSAPLDCAHPIRQADLCLLAP